MPNEQQALLALDEIEKVLHSATVGVERADHGGSSEMDICADYRRIRPRLDTALPMIASIPLYGAKIASAIRFLMQMADAQCRPPA